MAHKKSKKKGKKKKSKASGAMAEMPTNYQAEGDAYTLTEAAKIEKDKKRHKAAKKQLHKQQYYIEDALK